jgi:hypothetical protein
MRSQAVSGRMDIDLWGAPKHKGNWVFGESASLRSRRAPGPRPRAAGRRAPGPSLALVDVSCRASGESTGVRTGPLGDREEPLMTGVNGPLPRGCRRVPPSGYIRTCFTETQPNLFAQLGRLYIWPLRIFVECRIAYCGRIDYIGLVNRETMTLKCTDQSGEHQGKSRLTLFNHMNVPFSTPHIPAVRQPADLPRLQAWRRIQTQFQGGDKHISRLGRNNPLQPA